MTDFTNPAPHIKSTISDRRAVMLLVPPEGRIHLKNAITQRLATIAACLRDEMLAEGITLQFRNERDILTKLRSKL